jgi:hypothetical protein
VLDELAPLVTPDALKIGLVLALAFFTGIEREEHKQREATYASGGVRTFPLIGLVSYALALVSGPGLLPWTVGFAAVGALMLRRALALLLALAVLGLLPLVWLR